MKTKLSHIFCVAALGFGSMMSSCNDYFDTVPGEETTLDKTFASRGLTIQFMANIYSYIPDEHNQRFGAQSQVSGVWTGGSSEAEFAWDFVKSHEINNGAINATSSLGDWYWVNYYKAIAKANTFLAHIDENKELTAEELKRYRNEVRALRAIYSFYLFRIYGPFVIRDKVIEADASADQMDLARNSVDECLEWLDTELEEAAAGLPAQSEGDANWGHITRDIAKAYQAMVWLYGASPLFNGNTYYADLINEDGKQLFPQQVVNTKWQKARDYYTDWLKTYTQYTLNLRDYQGAPTSDIKKADPYMSLRAYQFDPSVPPTEEIIFYRKDGSNCFFYDLTPHHQGAASDYRGGTGLAATQELVDLYFMSDGTRIDDSEEYAKYEYGPQANGENTYPGDDEIYDEYLIDKKTYKEPLLKRTTFIDGKQAVLGQYYNREPRFYTDITFNQQKWLSSTPIYTGLAFDGNSGASIASHNFSHTGYVVRKGATTGAWASGNGIITFIRLGQIYLDYAESLIECQNAGIAGNGDQYETAIEYINKIRARAGIPGYAFEARKDARGLDCIVINKTYETIRNVLRRERTIELAFENHRYFDVRRWKVAGMEQGDGWVYPVYHKGGEGGDFWGMDPQAYEFKGFYHKKVFETRVYTERINLFPIPQDDINRGKLLKQNTGWSIVD